MCRTRTSRRTCLKFCLAAAPCHLRARPCERGIESLSETRSSCRPERRRNTCLTISLFSRGASLKGAGPRACGGIVVLNMIDDMHACRCAAEEFQEFGVFGGTEFADQSQSVARALYLRASAKSFFGDGFLNAALIFRGLGTDGIVGSPWRGFFRRRIRGFHFGHGVPSARGSLVRALRGVGARARLRIPSGSPRR